MKDCPNCHELVHISVMECPECHYQFSPPEEKEEATYKLYTDDIMGERPLEMEVRDWKWSRHVSKASGKEMLKVTYYGALSDPSVTEYFTVLHEGYAGMKALASIQDIAVKSYAMVGRIDDLEDSAAALTDGTPPATIDYRKDGKFYRVIRRNW